jgi:CrcB protein
MTTRRGAAKPLGMAATTPLAASGLVALGGGAGAVARYQTGRLLTMLLGPATVAAFPWATLTVNVVGSLAMGLLAGWLARFGSGGGETWRLLVGVGLLGGFTTFSAFSLELMLLIERGQAGTAFTYAAVSVLAGLTALYLGLIVMRLA